MTLVLDCDDFAAMLKNTDFLNYLSDQEYLLWDWNGTLLNDTDLCVEIIDKALLERGYSGLSKERYLEIFTIPVYDYYEKLELNQEVHTFEEIANNFISKYKAGRHSLNLYEGAREILEGLKSKQVKQILFSAAHIEELEFQVTNHALEGVFHELSGASDYQAGSKLERGIKLSDQNKNKPGVIIGDTIHDMEIGKEIGIETIWVSEGHQSVQRAMGHKSIDYIFDRKENSFFKNN